jgi:poly[(R)-3-hydroxyalkanoate] polymerase subunit PhaC
MSKKPVKSAKKSPPKKAAKKAPKKAPRKTPKKASEKIGKKTANPVLPETILEDPAKLQSLMAEMGNKGQEFLREYLETQPRRVLKQFEEPQDPLDVGGAINEVFSGYASHPEKLMQMQFGLWEDFGKLWMNASDRAIGGDAEPVAAPEPGDRRFNHEAWQKNQMLDFIKQSYLITGRWLRQSVMDAEHVDEHTKARALFHVEQYLSAIAPTNFPTTNPEVLEETLRTQGENLKRGYQNYLEDMQRGKGELAMKNTDLQAYEVGVNIATTPGKVVFQNDVLQLIQYNPTTEKVARRPLLIFPPWINKFYILDLQPENSLIRWLVEQGRTVFVCSWVNPGPEMRDYNFSDYMHKGIFAALDAVSKATGERQADTIGYCIGGTMLSSALCYMAKKDDNRVASATFFTAQTDFSEAGDLLLFVDDKQIENMEKQIDAAGGILPGTAMSKTFNMLRPNDLIWSVYIDNYLKGKEPKKFDLLYWNDDATNQPKTLHLFYLKNFYRDNMLSKGKMALDGVKLDLKKVTIPIFMQAGERDHIAPYRSVYNSARKFGGDVTYLLAGSGHIAGVINPPSKNKYYYRTNKALPAKIEKWVEKSSHFPGSWWPYWLQWLESQSEGEVPARIPGDGGLSVIEDAPGSYVKIKGV